MTGPIGPQTWGPHGWKFIHYITLAYPDKPTDDEKNNYKRFFESMAFVLPCSICSNHYTENLKLHPLNEETLSSRSKLVKWSIDMHNEVNKKNGKKVLSYEDAVHLITNKFGEKDIYDESSSNNFLLFFIIFIALITIAVIYKK